MTRHDIKAAEYRALAEAARQAREASTLDHVRQKHEQAFQTWSALADAEEDRGRDLLVLRSPAVGSRVPTEA